MKNVAESAWKCIGAYEQREYRRVFNLISYPKYFTARKDSLSVGSGAMVESCDEAFENMRLIMTFSRKGNICRALRSPISINDRSGWTMAGEGYRGPYRRVAP